MVGIGRERHCLFRCGAFVAARVRCQLVETLPTAASAIIKTRI